MLIPPAATLAAYAAATAWNGVEGDPSDQGDTVDHMIEYMQTTGIDGLLFGMEADIQPRSLLHMQQANSLLVGGPNFGLSMPDAWINEPDPIDPNTIQTWDVAGPPNPENGHDVMGLEYDGTGFLIDTWDERKRLTPAAIALYAEQVTAINRPNAFSPASGVNAAGLTLEQTNLDVPAMTG